MLKHRPVAIFFCVLALVTLCVSRFIGVAPIVYVIYAVAWSIVLFCGCYFIGLNFFVESVNHGAGTEKVLALSFDDGPTPFTATALDILKEKKVEAVFFCIGRRISGQEETMRRLVSEGHIIGNHSFSHHPLFDLFSSKKMGGDLEAMTSAVHSVTGFRPVLFRPPFGVTNPAVARVVKTGRYISIGWNLRSYDTMKKNPEKLRAKIRRGLKAGGIILLHDTAAVTLEALPGIIDDIRAAGYRLERLDKMCNLTPYA